jgi:hypothetical protein
MWHFRWGVPSRMTGEKRDTLPKDDGRENGKGMQIRYKKRERKALFL